MSPPPPNVANRTIFEGDNLDVMRGMNSECVDLIYLDPPFNSNRNYSAPIGSEAAGAMFKDTWTLSDLDIAWHNQIADVHLPLYKAIEASGYTYGDRMKSYLIMMAVRLLEMRRILKPTGSIYLHCDDSADYYLRVLMDSIFGESSWQATIHRKRTNAHNDKVFGRVMDTIHVYGNPPRNDVMMDLDADYVAKQFTRQDEEGRYGTVQLTGPKTSAGESGQPWSGYDPTSIGRCWSVPKTGRYAAYIERRFITGYRSIKGIHDRLDALEKAGLVHWTSGGTPRLKQYLQPNQKQVASHLWLDCKDNQKTDFKTEKSLKALERIIAAASDEGDLVFDPFCGCATACIAAERLGREWVGVDLSPKAVELVEMRAVRELGMMGGIQSISRRDIPQRTDLLPPPSLAQSKIILYGLQSGNCEGCAVHFLERNLTIDHIIPRSKGGTDHLENLQLLCAACNSIKRDRPMEYLIARLNKFSELNGNASKQRGLTTRRRDQVLVA